MEDRDGGVDARMSAAKRVGLAFALAAEGPPAHMEEEDSPWYFSDEELEYSPSRQDGIDSKKEAAYRRSYCQHIQETGIRLKVPQVTIATAMVFCHRFYARQSLMRYDRFDMASTCLFLAAKVEETARSLREVIMANFETKYGNDKALAAQMKESKDAFEKLKDVILTNERVLLQTLAFDLNIVHPYKFVLETVNACTRKPGGLGGTGLPGMEPAEERALAKKLAQASWNFVNDSLRTTMCLVYNPYEIAMGAIYLALKFLKIKLPNMKIWASAARVQHEKLEAVAKKMLDLYETTKPEAKREAGPEVRRDARLAPTTPGVPSKPLKQAPLAADGASPGAASRAGVGGQAEAWAHQAPHAQEGAQPALAADGVRPGPENGSARHDRPDGAPAAQLASAPALPDAEVLRMKAIAARAARAASAAAVETDTGAPGSQMRPTLVKEWTEEHARQEMEELLATGVEKGETCPRAPQRGEGEAGFVAEAAALQSNGPVAGPGKDGQDGGSGSKAQETGHGLDRDRGGGGAGHHSHCTHGRHPHHHPRKASHDSDGSGHARTNGGAHHGQDPVPAPSSLSAPPPPSQTKSARPREHSPPPSPQAKVPRVALVGHEFSS